MKLQVDKPQRLAKMRAHTATHLLHSQLKNILWTTKQAGSYVDQDYLRLDFQASENLSHKQLKTIQDSINQTIKQALDIKKIQTTLQQAKEMWATALFENKYDDESVRVIKIADLSIELCGGTHVSNTSHIWALKIISQESIASWIKRITANTGPKVYQQAIDLENKLQNIADKIDSPVNQIQETLDKTLQEYEEKKQLLESLRESMLDQKLQDINSYSQEPFDQIIDLSQDTFFEKIKFKKTAHKAKNIFTKWKILIFKESGHFAIISNTDWDANKYARSLDLRGGGPPNFVQGKDPKIVNTFNQ